MAQKDPNSREFKQTCAKIWKALQPHSSLDSFRPVPRRHNKSIFLGYADITVGVALATGVVIYTKLRGLGVKLLNGRPHLEVKQELGRDGKSYFPIYAPVGQSTGGEHRMVLTTFIFSQPEVQDLVNNIEQRLREAEQGTSAPQPAASVAGGATPFDDAGADNEIPF